MLTRLPWHADRWRRIEKMLATGRLPHALMLRGPPGVGKEAFARALAAALLCAAESPPARPCGECRGCRLVAGGAHPDLVHVGVAEGSREIRIDAIRELIAAVSLTARYAGRKVVIVSPAEQLNRHAANTLLKTLEEPPGDCVFLLVANRAGMVPATVRSRCQNLAFPAPGEGECLDWLAARTAVDVDTAATLLRLAGGAPMAAAALAEEEGVAVRDRILRDVDALVRAEANAVGVAEGWRALDRDALVRWLGSLSEDLVRLGAASPRERLTHADAGSAMQSLARRLDLAASFRLLERCTDARWLDAVRANPNPRLLLESLAEAWARAARN